MGKAMDTQNATLMETKALDYLKCKLIVFKLQRNGWQSTISWNINGEPLMSIQMQDFNSTIKHMYVKRLDQDSVIWKICACVYILRLENEIW